MENELGLFTSIQNSKFALIFPWVLLEQLVTRDQIVASDKYIDKMCNIKLMRMSS